MGDDGLEIMCGQSSQNSLNIVQIRSTPAERDISYNICTCEQFVLYFHDCVTRSTHTECSAWWIYKVLMLELHSLARAIILHVAHIMTCIRLACVPHLCIYCM